MRTTGDSLVQVGRGVERRANPDRGGAARKLLALNTLNGVIDGLLARTRITTLTGGLN